MSTCVVGLQWGDEGKGKIVDLLAGHFDMVVRYQGGGNAGHTIVEEAQTFILHLVPAGILHPRVQAVIGNGVVVDPQQLLAELQVLRDQRVRVDGRLFLSERAHLVMPYHKQLDALTEQTRGKLGTTKRGVGPCYTDKIARVGIRVIDLYAGRHFEEKLRSAVENKNRIFRALFDAEPLSYEQILKDYLGYAEQLRPYVSDTVLLLHRALREGRKILFEGAQGTLLDVDLGTYPFVTSSNSTTCGIAAGLGIPPRSVQKVLGVTKAYTTRVGEGPFPTQMEEAEMGRLRERGKEYGATTGRARRCGWLDLVALKYAVTINGVDSLAVTKMDVLSGYPMIRVCTAYRHGGERLDHFPCRVDVLEEIEPEYLELEGWEGDFKEVRSRKELPRTARLFVELLEGRLGVPIEMISVGAERSQVIRL
jgi:adenylosuccinate synthase